MTIYSKDFAVCPWCGHQTNSSVSHLYGYRMPVKAGSWYCDKCRKPYDILVKAPGDVEITKAAHSDNRRFIPGLSLLRRGEGEDAVYFVMKKDRYETNDGDTPEEAQDRERFFYEEHSCPTNWLRNCVAVIEGADADPHGFLTFVRCVDVPQDFDRCQADWREIFPEAFNDGPIIEGVVSPSIKLLQ